MVSLKKRTFDALFLEKKLILFAFRRIIFLKVAELFRTKSYSNQFKLLVRDLLFM